MKEASPDVPGDYELDMLFLGEVMWDSPSPYTDGGDALDILDTEYVPPRFDPIVKLYESKANLSASTAASALSDGYGIVFHEGHANIGVASVGPDALTIPHLDALDNAPRAGLWYSVGCWSAAIDYDTFGEHWVTNPDGGGVAYVGNSRYGWGCPGHPGECVSDLYSQQFMNSLFSEGLVHAGLVHADAKHHYVGQARIDNYMRYAMYELNLLGDPETPIWTDAPAPLTVVHPDAVSVGDGTANVTVEVLGGGAEVVGATVCVSGSELGIYEVATTDEAGVATVSLPVDAAGIGRAGRDRPEPDPLRVVDRHQRGHRRRGRRGARHRAPSERSEPVQLLDRDRLHPRPSGPRVRRRVRRERAAGRVAQGRGGGGRLVQDRVGRPRRVRTGRRRRHVLRPDDRRGFAL